MSYKTIIDKYYKIINETDNIKNIIYRNLKNKELYIKGNKIDSPIDIIGHPYTQNSINVLNSINIKKNSDILIISSNIYYVEACLINKNKVTLFLINIDDIGTILLLKEKYKDLINIYYINYRYDINSYNTITELIANKKFNTIIVDIGINTYNINIDASSIIGTLLCNNNLINDGYYINLTKLPDSDLSLSFLNINNNLFINHKYNDNPDATTLNIYNNIKNKLDDNIKKSLLYYLENDNIKKSEKFVELSKEDYNNIGNRWEEIFLINKTNLDKLKKDQKKEKKSRMINYKPELAYQRQSFKRTSINKIPETINDLIMNSIFNEESFDYNPKCHWGQKKLLLSEIQFFTKVCESLNTTSLKDYAVVYIGSADGYHLPILYNLFPELIWLLYDPRPYADVVMKHPLKDKSVFIFNQFYVDDTIEHSKKYSQGRKILFISDIRVDNAEVKIIKDMRDQAYWGMELDSPFMYLKFRLPYEEMEEIPVKAKQLELNDKRITNPDLNTDKKNHLIYLKGDIYLQIYPPQYSAELRLYVEKNKETNKYDLAEYNYMDVETKIAYFNNFIRSHFNYNGDDIPLELINMIPSYDNSIECLMEFEIMRKYYKHFYNMTDNIELIRKIYDMNFFLERLTHRKFITCAFDTNMKLLKRDKQNDINKSVKLSVWKDIHKLNIELSAKNQYSIIEKQGYKVFGQDRQARALTYLKNYIKDNKYVVIN
jgi:hypothetical protein